MKRLPSDNQPVMRSGKKQVRNRHTGAAGITDREATQLKSMWHKLDKLSKKKKPVRSISQTSTRSNATDL